MFQVRENEPGYALLNDTTSQSQNRYGISIETVTEGDELFGKSLNINDDDEVGENPNRYKQHGFYFNADNCIACCACEAVCSEKYDNPAHIAFTLSVQAMMGAFLVLVLMGMGLFKLNMHLGKPHRFYRIPARPFWDHWHTAAAFAGTALTLMPQLGVVYERHHSFKMSELLETMCSTSLQEKIAQVRRIVTG